MLTIPRPRLRPSDSSCSLIESIVKARANILLLVAIVGTIGYLLGAIFIATDQPLLEKQDDSVLVQCTVGREGRFILLPVEVGDRQYPFIFDTGSTYTIYDTSFLARMGQPRGHVEGQTHAGKVPVTLFDSIPARLGTISLQTDDPVLCMDLKFIQQFYGQGIQGIAGISHFRKLVVQVDFDQGTFAVFRPPAKAPAEWGQPIEVTYGSEGTPYVVATIGGEKARLLVDTANLGNGSLADELFLHLQQKGKLKVTGSGLNATAAGNEVQSHGSVGSFALGPFAHEDLPFHKSRVSSLGLRYWSRYRMTLDFSRQVMYLAKGKGYARRDAPDMIGLALHRVNDRLVVHSVEKGMPASRAGLKPGDLVLSIQGRPAADYELFHLFRHVFEQEGTRITMTIERNQQKMDVSFILQSTMPVDQNESRTGSAPASSPEVRVPPMRSDADMGRAEIAD